MIESTETTRVSKEVTDLFGLYRAEWMNGQLFDLFTEPQYFGQLKTSRPCVLVGGRGTGKTTVLKGLSYEGQFALTGAAAETIQGWDFIGLYYRADTNRITAFTGHDLSDTNWIRCFAHYFNLQLCTLMLDFVEWFERRTLQRIDLSANGLRRVCASLNLPACSSLSELAEAVDLAVISFEASVNNIADSTPTNLSMQKAPVDHLADALQESSALSGKHFSFLIDEYENFQDYQQRVVNTIIKHANPRYSFKVGVRELGWRVRATLNSNEQLTHPADYERIDIVQDFGTGPFADFAARVCNERLERVRQHSDSLPARIQDALPRLSIDDEAVALGAKARNDAFLDALSAEPELRAFAEQQTAGMLYLYTFWGENEQLAPAQVVRNAIDHPGEWRNRYNNYAHAALFSIRQGKRGIRKYYAGWEVFLLLSSGNIRFLLELVHQSLLNHARDHDLTSPVSARHQTEAAQQVGRKYLAELEGIVSEGARLTKLLLGLGRVFQVLAENPLRHSPEINQFCLADPGEGKATPSEGKEVDDLLKLAVMHLALVRSSGTKQLDESDTLEYDYMLHPIFAPFFSFSHRRKRKIELGAGQLLALLHNPSAAIRDILGSNRHLADGGLPEQMTLFEGFYSGSA